MTTDNLVADTTELATISRLKQAQLVLHEVKTLDEIKQLIDQSEAIKSYARAQQLSKEIQDDVAEYGLYATRQMGIISKSLEKSKNQYACPKHGQAKRTVLESAGIDRRRAAEAEIIASIDEGDFAAIIAGKRVTDTLTKSAVVKEVRNILLREERYSSVTVTPAKLTGKFDIIYADPPYAHDFCDTKNRDVKNHYPTMSIEEIKSMEIPCEDNAVLFLWATAPLLDKALVVMEAWGFTYRTCAVWDKQKIGMGFWFRGQHELLLVGVKGEYKSPLTADRVSSVYREARTQHSKKPDFYYDMIERMFPQGRYLELFARQRYNNKWAVWGNHIINEGVCNDEL